MGSFIYYNAKYVIISMSVTAKLVLIYASRTIEKAVMPKKTKKKEKKRSNFSLQALKSSNDT